MTPSISKSMRYTHFKYDEIAGNPSGKKRMLDYYKQFGYVTIENVFDRETLNRLSDILIKIRNEEKPVTGDHPTQVHRRHPEIIKVSENERLMDCVNILLEKKGTLIGSMVLYRDPGTRGSNCHQDNYYLHTAPPEGQINVWIAVDRTTRENGCLYVYPESHAEKILPVKFQWAHLLGFLRQFAQALTRQKVAVGLHFGEVTIPKKYEKIYDEVEAGSIIFTHGNILHGSDENRTSDFRKTLTFCYLAQGARVRQGLTAGRQRKV